MVYLLKKVIFHGYVKQPDGRSFDLPQHQSTVCTCRSDWKFLRSPDFERPNPYTCPCLLIVGSMLFMVPLQKSYKKNYMSLCVFFILLNPQFHPIFWDIVLTPPKLPVNIIDLTSQGFSSGSFKNPSCLVSIVLKKLPSNIEEHRNNPATWTCDILKNRVFVPLVNCITGWWCNNHLEKSEFVNGVGMTSHIWTIIHMFETTNQYKFHFISIFSMSSTAGWCF